VAKLPADIHMHTKLCGHAVGEIHEYIERGIALGLEAIGFSFHLPVAIPVPYKVNKTREEMDFLVTEIDRLRRTYGATIPILFGGEADYLPGSEREVEELAAAYPLDYLIGSVHFVGDWAFDHPAEIERYADWDLRELYARYFGLVRDAVRTRLFDIVGHIDLVKKFGYRPSSDWSEILGETCAAIRTQDLCVEINTAGFDKPVKEQYASDPFIRECFELGIPIAFGSDAHAPREVGRYFGEAVALARGAGYRSYAYFGNRRRSLRPIP